MTITSTTMQCRDPSKSIKKGSEKKRKKGQVVVDLRYWPSYFKETEIMKCSCSTAVQTSISRNLRTLRHGNDV